MVYTIKMQIYNCHMLLHVEALRQYLQILLTVPRQKFILNDVYLSLSFFFFFFFCYSENNMCTHMYI